MTVLQAIDYINSADLLSSKTYAVYSEVRKIFPKFVDDMPKYKVLEKVKSYFEKSDALILFEEALPVNSINDVKRSQKINL